MSSVPVGGWPLQRLAEVDSSNSALLRRAAMLPDRYALVVDAQSAGRGRQGRRWHSPPGANLYLSLFARLPLVAAQLSGLSLAIGIAVAETLRAGGAVDVGVKWPNDLVARERKLGGILIESAGSREGRVELVIGLGLNLAMPRDADVGQPWIDLATLGVASNREAWLPALLVAIGAALDEFVAAGFAGFLPRWQQVDLLAGRELVVHGGERSGGTACGVDADGALRVVDDQGEWRCRAGEVSVRALGQAGFAE
jgi:BirA family transcriptional regulator, biotin operon repressor / biotin---[acetyl-CoA-carboxylase] ligase